MINLFAQPSRNTVLKAFIIAYALLSIYTMLEFLIVSHFGDSFRWVQLNAMVHGRASRPFVYRILVPKIIKVILYLTPDFIRAEANESLQAGVIAQFMEKISPGMWTAFANPDVLYVRLLMMIIVYGFLCAYIFMLYKLAETLYPTLWGVALFAPIVGLMMIIGFAHPVLYIYDFALLFLNTTCFYFLKKQQWKQFFICFFIACLNKETSLFIVLFYILWFSKRLPRPQYIHYLKIQTIIYVAIKFLLYLVYRKTPGFFLEYHPDVQAILLFSGCTFIEMSCYISIIFLLTYRWHEKPLFARYILWLMPLMYLAYYLYGVPGEYRVFFDLFPLLTLLITDTLVVGTGIAKIALFKPTS